MGESILCSKFLQLFYIKLLLSCSARFISPQLQSQGCHDKVVVTADINSSSDSDILQQSSSCPTDHQVVNLVLASSIGGTPGELVDFIVCEECPSDVQIISLVEFK